MTTAQHPIVKGEQGAKRGHTHSYDCQHPDPIYCRMARHGLGPQEKTFVECMGGCNCPCHVAPNGGAVSPDAWIPPGHSEPLGVLRAVRLEPIEEEEDTSWLL